MRLAVFASGGGSNFQSIVEATNSGLLSAEVVLCVSNRSDAGVLTRAEAEGIESLILDPSDFDDKELYETVLLEQLASRDVDFIALAGYMKMIPAGVVRAFSGRMLNIHPALLPAYGGPGMYGKRVHGAVLAAGESISGATVHLVDEEYDTGPIVLQESVPVLPTDTPETLAARVLLVEHELFPKALALFAEQQITVDGRTVTIL